MRIAVRGVIATSFLTFACSDAEFSSVDSGGGDADVITMGAFRAALVSDAPSDRERIAAYLDNRVPSEDIVTSIKIRGKAFDCIPIERQFSIREQNLSAEQIATAPTVLPPELPALPTSDDARLPEDSGEPETAASCPVGTVPFEHFEQSDVEQFGSLEVWLNRRGNVAADPQSPPASGHDYAVWRDYENNTGFEAFLNVWKPLTNGGTNFSLSQIWVVGCSLSGQTCTGSSRQTVEVGWIRCASCDEPLGDDGEVSELFIFTTPDDYSTSCWNGECSQWVQTSSSVALGMPLTSSVFEGTQRAAQLLWYRDPTGDNHWWLRYGSEWVGYYKNNDSWFDSTGLETQARYFNVGGENVDPNGGSNFGELGSGRCPSSYSTADLYSRVAYVRNANYLTTAGAWGTPAFNTSFEDAPYADLGAINPHGSSSTWQTHFYYGAKNQQVGTCP